MPGTCVDLVFLEDAASFGVFDELSVKGRVAMTLSGPEKTAFACVVFYQIASPECKFAFSH